MGRLIRPLIVLFWAGGVITCSVVLFLLSRTPPEDKQLSAAGIEHGERKDQNMDSPVEQTPLAPSEAEENVPDSLHILTDDSTSITYEDPGSKPEEVTKVALPEPDTSQGLSIPVPAQKPPAKTQPEPEPAPAPPKSEDPPIPIKPQPDEAPKVIHITKETTKPKVPIITPNNPNTKEDDRAIKVKMAFEKGRQMWPTFQNYRNYKYPEEELDRESFEGIKLTEEEKKTGLKAFKKDRCESKNYRLRSWTYIGRTGKGKWVYPEGSNGKGFAYCHEPHLRMREITSDMTMKHRGIKWSNYVKRLP